MPTRLTGCGAATSDSSWGRMSRPNILWIVTTQWRAQACGYAGDPNARTPHLDRLAKESVNFRQAVTPHPAGPFARAALLTGIPCPENRVKDYFDPLPPTARTFAHQLNERGYATAFFGKWHLGRRDPAAPLVGEAHATTIVPPESRGGFGFWEGFESGFLLNDPWLHGTRLPAPARFEGYQSDVVCERAAGWIREQGEIVDFSNERMTREWRPESIRDLQSTIRNRTPWFTCVSLEAPHPPYAAPAAGIAPREPRDVSLPLNVPTGEAAAKARTELAGYYAHIEATDRAIGRLLAAVDPIGDSTVVVFTSVHGDMHGAHGLFRKGWPHEESVRVPLLLRHPRHRHAVTGIEDRPLSLLDLSQLMLAEMEKTTLKLPDAFARISMPVAVNLPHQCDRVWRGMRTKDRKLVLNADGSPWLFFDLENDPFELRNLAGDPSWMVEMTEWRMLLEKSRSR